MAKKMGQKRAIPSPFGLRIKNRLYQTGMTQVQLAREIGAAPAYLTDIVYGRRGPGKYEEPIKRVLKL